MKQFETKCGCGHGNVTISENNTKLVANGVQLHYDIGMATTWIFMCNKCGKGLTDVPFETIKKLRTVILNTDKQKTLPRKMLVWGNHREAAVERTVFQILPENVKYGRYLAVNSASEEELEQGEKYYWTAWDNAEEIEETFVDKAISEKMKEKDSLIDELLKGEPKFEPIENKDYPSCLDCAFEYYYEHEEPCSTCKDCSNFKEEKPSTLSTEARLDAIEKEIKKLKKKIKCQNNP